MEPESRTGLRPDSRSRTAGADHVRAVRTALVDQAKYRDVHDKPGLLDQWTRETRVTALDSVDTRPLPGRTRASVERPTEVTV
ncbi:hypothetical protein [Streptomyces sp. NPDC058092]|uniref:hypothetical protein n=1 Tax=Streptomyces sp. NPDC058092 TaxID=3346336 RepID=UPI0036E02071